MRTLLTSFSLAALFTLATACAVDPDAVDTEESESFDDVELSGANLNEAIELPARDPDNGRSIHDPQRGLEKFEQHQQPSCEQSYDCESKICDQEIHRCRDYPF